MARNNYSYQKYQRELSKKKKRQEKLQRKLDKKKNGLNEDPTRVSDIDVTVNPVNET